MPIVQINGQTLFYESLGDGPPLLLMHGWMQVGHELIGLAQELARDYRVILPDLPGYGRSVPPLRRFTPDFYHRDAELMGKLPDALKLTNVHILGFSDGGEVALILGSLRPDLCRSVVAWGAIGTYPPELCASARTYSPNVAEHFRPLHPSQNIDRWPGEWADAVCAIVEAGGDLSLKRAPEIKCPLLLMVGDNDILNPVSAAQHFVETARAGSQNGKPARMFRPFVQTGHAIHEERPEQFIETVRDFLRSYCA